MLRGSLSARPCRQAKPAFGLALRATRSAALSRSAAFFSSNKGLRPQNKGFRTRRFEPFLGIWGFKLLNDKIKKAARSFLPLRLAHWLGVYWPSAV